MPRLISELWNRLFAAGSCRECGAPDSRQLQKRDVNAGPHGKVAVFSCLSCRKRIQVPLNDIDKAVGVQVRCPWCRCIATIPYSVWCTLCGTSLSSGWHGRISRAGATDERPIPRTVPKKTATNAPKAERTTGITLKVLGEWGFFHDRDRFVRGLWFSEYASTQKQMRLIAVMSMIQARKEGTVENSDYAAVVEGHVNERKLPRTKGGGYAMIFPSAPSEFREAL